RLHNAIGWTFVLSTMLFINAIVGFSSYQLTPSGSPDALLSAAINPSYVTEFVHRHVGNLSYGALLLAAGAVVWFRFFRRRTGKDEEEAPYYDWLADVALLIGLAVTLLQPLVGGFYTHQVRVGSLEAWLRMMPGENGWMFRVQIGLLGTAFFLGDLYMLLGLRRGDPGARTVAWMRYSLVAVALLTGLAVLPPTVPLGQMDPWKFIAMAGFILVTAVDGYLYLKVRRTFRWGQAAWQARATLGALAVVMVALFVIMGIIRESARGPWLINGQMGPDQAQELVRP
ncbi:MAG: hypothetical protein M1582_03390, partial [Actinobacteria bacterium]|nr:hypothetical protein [Actinomycetota bacterium]